jgi:hypothetical protein
MQAVLRPAQPHNVRVCVSRVVCCEHVRASGCVGAGGENLVDAARGPARESVWYVGFDFFSGGTAGYVFRIVFFYCCLNN